MIKKLKKWYRKNFKVLSLEEVKEWGFTHVRNVFGDEINALNCRSIWKDKNGKTYRVDELYKPFPLPSDFCNFDNLQIVKSDGTKEDLPLPKYHKGFMNSNPPGNYKSSDSKFKED